MKKIKLQRKQKTATRMKQRLVIATAGCFLIAFGIFFTANMSDIEDTMASASGDYRTIESGNWEDAAVWEMYDGKKWQPAQSAPLHSSAGIYIKSGHSVTATQDITATEVTVENQALLKLNCQNFKIDRQGSKGQMTIKGTLDAGTCIIEGTGKFNLGDNSTMIIGSSEGLCKGGMAGNVQVNGNRYFSSFGTYVYQGTTPQLSGKGLPPNIYKVVINNPSGVQLESNITVTGTLELNKGTLNTSNHTLIVGTGNTVTGQVIRQNGGVAGNFKRWIGEGALKDILFPIMEGSNYNAIYFTINGNDFSTGSFEFKFYEGKANSTNQSNAGNTRTICIGESGYYIVTAADGFETAMFKLQSSLAISKHENKNYWLVKKNPNAAEAKDENEPVAEAITGIKAHPNPFTDKFRLDFTLPSAGEVELHLMNAGGQLVYSEKIQGNEMSNTYEYFDKKNLAPGFYFLNITAGNKVETIKLIKK